MVPAVGIFIFLKMPRTFFVGIFRKIKMPTLFFDHESFFSKLFRQRTEKFRSIAVKPPKKINIKSTMVGFAMQELLERVQVRMSMADSLQ